ncbi:hypothetical protein BXY85_0155 [Roseivirga pacifica]|uniref:Conjugative transposon protein TraN n=1 Tax=Roseivirga pacifica TaxID=1267423 RepID=A0A1I0R7H9_9BACT|nr:hypothetical protein [Roseivirga pacifica]RKQ49167.1 hypothetical protein BXY85_0155 [Roseivirga pacifica]SEW36698.1 hypothetical protein SAMN05216290_3208 [Roseivirga pacifica]
MKTTFKHLFTSLLFIASLQTQAQNLDNFKPVGNQLLQDIQNSSSSALPSKSVLETYFRKAILPSQNVILSDTEFSERLDKAATGLKEAYEKNTADILNTLNIKNFEHFELSMYAIVPLNVEIHESKSSGAFAVPDKTKDNLSTVKALFLIGDDSQRLLVNGVLIVLNNEYHLLKLENELYTLRVSSGQYYEFLKRFKKIIELQISPSDIGENPLFGKQFKKEWYRCSIQLKGDGSPTLIRTQVSSDEFFGMESKTEIKTVLFSNLEKNEALENIYKFMSVLAQELIIPATPSNQLRESIATKPYTYQLLNKDDKSGIELAQLQIKYASKDQVIFNLEVKLIPQKNNRFDVELWMIREK